MDQETLFTASKWDILKLLSEQPLSPIELSSRSNTSVANVSQQLRLLEMAGLVKSERIPNRDKGQPRILYSLSGNHSFLISASNDFVDKKLLKLSSFNKVILRIWFYERPEIHYFLEKAFWGIEQHFDKVDALAFDTRSTDAVSLVVFSRDSSLKEHCKPFSVKGPDGVTRRITFDLVNPDAFGDKVAASSLYMLYDPSVMLGSFEKTPQAAMGGRRN